MARCKLPKRLSWYGPQQGPHRRTTNSIQRTIPRQIPGAIFMTDEEIQIRLQSLEDYPGHLRAIVSTHNSIIEQLQAGLRDLREDYSKFKRSVYTIHPELLV